MKNLTKTQKLYIGSVINKLPYGGYSGYPKISTLENDEIYIPAKEGKPDFDFTEVFIRAIQKLAIADVVAWLDAQIEVTKQVVFEK